MKKISAIFLSSILLLGSISAQNFNHKPDLSKYKVNAEKLSSDSLKILAVMVEFGKDRDTQTFGNGKFGTIYSKDYGNDILDPLPHNQQYFNDHLTFVKNYFEKVSSGNLTVLFNVLPDIYTVSKTMRNYSPSSEATVFNELGDFSEEVWNLVDAQNPGFNFANYNMFVIFHAGVSRGLVTPGSIGLERDIPSIYLSLNSLKKIYGDTFDGISVSNGSFKITNTAIMPETDSREIDGITGKTLIQLTTNGLLCTTVGNFLGVPDLVVTQTGKSAIGRFGLMDPQGFYAYEGIFPPEPSPWVKVFLGWETPVTINLQDVHLVLNAQRAPPGRGRDTTLIKVPLNADEYYLIENRSRDARKDGAIITYKVGGQTFTKTFPYDVDGFRFFNVDTIKGVVTDIDEPDWAVPGLDRNDVDGVFKDVGIVIWHIDQKVIDENLTANRVNADINHRGIFIEEADGIFDIGNDFQNILTGSVETREAFKADTWYKDNPSELYKNIFDADSKPATITNSGANTFISFSNFSAPDTKMSFDLKFGGEVIKPLMSLELPSFSPLWFTYATTNAGEYFLTQDKSTSIVSEIDSLGKRKGIFHSFSNTKPAVVTRDSSYYLLGAYGSMISILARHSTNNFLAQQILTDTISTSLSVSEISADMIKFYFGTVTGKVLKYSFQISTQSFQKLSEVQAFAQNEPVKNIALDSDNYFAISKTSYNDFNGNKIEFFNGSEIDDSLSQINLTQASSGEYIAIISFDKKFVTPANEAPDVINKGFYIVQSGTLRKTIEIDNNGKTSMFSLANIKNTGDNFIVSFANGKLNAANIQGNSADYFPIDLNGMNAATASLSADLNVDGSMDLIQITDNGELFAFSGSNGQLLDEFPFSAGSGISLSPLLFVQNGKTAIAVFTNGGTLSTWNISEFNSETNWTTANGNLLNTSFVPKAKSINKITDFFPESRAYNWPNPVYGNATQIRFYVAENSKVNVKIFDLGGDLVAELSANATGGFDNEITWNVSNIQSGVYLARLEVTANAGGQSSSKNIKIVVIK